MILFLTIYVSNFGKIVMAKEIKTWSMSEILLVTIINHLKLNNKLEIFTSYINI